ncbi:MAG: hypothetical protein NZ481_02060 [Candidatus Kapabacteria bacterium]|nr:hypothetical protein [Candidatus Kapabacteria bacterium]
MVAGLFVLVAVATALAGGRTVSDTSALQRDTSLWQPLPIHGALSAVGTVEPYRSFTRPAILTLPYRTLEDVLEWRTPAYVLSTGLAGDWNIPLLFGERPRDAQVYFDGVSAISGAVGLFPPSMLMPEFMEQVSILIGADAAVLAGANGGTAYWVQQPWYNTRTPYTRVWYCQSAYDFIATDGVFSQNIAPNLNATAGFRRLTSPGRYVNQWLDGWNTRALLRWNISPRLNLSLVHRFANWGLGTNGGVNTALSDDPTNERTAIVEYPRLDQRLFRHDLQLVATEAHDGGVRSASLAVRAEEWNVYRPPQWTDGSTVPVAVRWHTTALLAAARWEERFDSSLAAIGGAEGLLERGTESMLSNGLSLWQVAPYAFARWRSGHGMEIRGGARVVLRNGTVYPIVGVAAQAAIGPVTASLDGVLSVRFPSQVECACRPERVQLVLLGLAWGGSSDSIALRAFVRRRANRLESIPLLRGDTIVSVHTQNAAQSALESGITIETAWSLFGVEFRPSLVASFEGGNRLPLFYSAASARYVYPVGRNRLSAELFVRARTAVRATRFIPHVWGYVDGTEWSTLAFDGFTLALSAELGNAVVKLAVGNLLSAYYATLSTFPQYDRHITLSVAWTFFD